MDKTILFLILLSLMLVSCKVPQKDCGVFRTDILDSDIETGYFSHERQEHLIAALKAANDHIKCLQGKR